MVVLGQIGNLPLRHVMNDIYLKTGYDGMELVVLHTCLNPVPSWTTPDGTSRCKDSVINSHEKELVDTAKGKEG